MTTNDERPEEQHLAVEERGDVARRESETDPDSAYGDDTSPEAPLFLDEQRSSYRERWDEIQTRFVDDPKQAVQDADGLVNTVVSDLESAFRSRREALEASWQRGDDVSTEDLRLALQGYRSFFGRLLGD